MAYKRRFSDEDAELMEQDAEAAGRITAAERKMALAGNSFNNRNNQIADLTAAAHERRMASRARFLGAGDGVVSPQERAAIERFQRDQGLTGRESAIQDFERGMARDRIKGDVAVAHEKRMGMKEQGSDAATVTANATVEGNRSRFGFFDNDGTYRPGSDVKSAEARGLTDFEKNVLTNQTKLDIANSNNNTKREIAAGNNETKRDIATENNDTKRALEEQKRIAAAEKEKGRLKLQYTKLEQKDKADVTAEANKLVHEKGIEFDDAVAKIMATREQAQQNAVPQEGATKTLSSGRKVVYRNGTWDFAD